MITPEQRYELVRLRLEQFVKYSRGHFFNNLKINNLPHPKGRATVYK